MLSTCPPSRASKSLYPHQVITPNLTIHHLLRSIRALPLFRARHSLSLLEQALSLSFGAGTLSLFYEARIFLSVPFRTGTLSLSPLEQVHTLSLSFGAGISLSSFSEQTLSVFRNKHLSFGADTHTLFLLFGSTHYLSVFWRGHSLSFSEHASLSSRVRICLGHYSLGTRFLDAVLLATLLLDTLLDLLRR